MSYTIPEKIPPYHSTSRSYPILYYPCKPMPAPKAGCRVGRQYAPQNAVRGELHLTNAEMQALPEYSASIPSGKGLGKRWRARANKEGTLWIVLQYAELHPLDRLKWPGEIAILTFTPVVNGGKPGAWRERP